MFNFFTKALIKKQLKGKVPEAEMEKLLEVIEKNPDFFQQMVAYVQDKVIKGMSQEDAAKSFMQEQGDVARKVFGK